MSEKLKSILLIVLGNFIFAIAVVYFVFPYNILSGGVAGIGIIVEQLSGISATIVIDILVISTFILGYLVLGKEFALKTFISSIVYPIFITVLSYFPYHIEADPYMIVIYGGILTGIGLSLVLREDASTGGMDVPSIIMHRYTGMPLHIAFFIVDSITALVGVLVFSIQDVMVGIVFVYLYNSVINKMMVPKTDRAVSIFIISEKKDEINEYIHTKLDRGTTLVPVKGGYTDENREAIMTVVSKQQYHNLEKVIEKIDKFAFVVVSDAKEIKGEGFTYDIRV
ncbi:MAG TPA: YitT family protein [Erysipelotrichaceae bacterium]|nr:YitT family protein [Erysipelotrichaceae bacterium]